MENIIIQMEYEMWESVLHQDVANFRKLVSPDAVMVCGGYRCLGTEYASFIPDFMISGYEIRHMEVITSSEREVTLHYVIETRVDDVNAKDLSGLFHVVSIWKKNLQDWTLIFNMDSRILEQ